MYQQITRDQITKPEIPEILYVSVQYDGGFLPDIILLTQCYYHRGTRLNAMKRFCIFSY